MRGRLWDRRAVQAPEASDIRFAAELPSERWHAEIADWWLADGMHAEILCFIYDHAATRSPSPPIAASLGLLSWPPFRKTYEIHGIPGGVDQLGCLLTISMLAFTVEQRIDRVVRARVLAD